MKVIYCVLIELDLKNQLKYMVHNWILTEKKKSYFKEQYWSWGDGTVGKTE